MLGVRICFCLLAVLLSGCMQQLDRPRLKLQKNQVLVKEGDTLYAIALRHNLTPGQLVRANGLATSVIQPGQVLLLPAPGPLSQDVSFEIQEAPSVKGARKSYRNEIQAATPQKRSGTTTQGVSGGGLLVQSGSGLLWPVRGTILRRFGQMKGPLAMGIAIASPLGTAVAASDAGRVIYAGRDLADYGLLLLVRHTNGQVTAYGHLSECFVQKDEDVARGQVVGAVGRSGLGSGEARLYFELRVQEPGKKKTKSVDPLPHLGG